MKIISSYGAATGISVIDFERCMCFGKCSAICPVEVLQAKNGDITVERFEGRPSHIHI